MIFTAIVLIILTTAIPVHAGQVLINDQGVSDRFQDYEILHGTATSAASFINETFRLDQDIHIEINGADGPLFDPEQMKIIMPVTFVSDITERFNSVNYSDSGLTATEATQDVLLHTVFHEFAHAIIAMYDIPVVGKEEDAADALATILLIEFLENGREIALSAADLFDIESDDTEVLHDEDFWDEHSLDDQRYFSTLCYVYGSDPEGYTYLQKNLSEERAELCIEDYLKIKDSWFSLIEPFTKKH